MGGSGLSAGKLNLRCQGQPLQPASCLHHRYEDEINKRTNAENDFVVLKKVKEKRGPLGAQDWAGGNPWGCSVLGTG